MTFSVAETRRATFDDLDNIQLRTVGIDVGSSTSHVTFSEIHLQRLGDRLSTRYVPVERRILHESRIVLTPYVADYTIDAAALADFVTSAYTDAGIAPTEVDSGAVILTGEAIKRHNAAAISERLAAAAGSFVCATAGHRLEAVIAAHGSGAVAASRERPGRVLNVDIGGGTTKFALLDDGMVLETGAMAIGGRLVATDDGVVTRLEPAGEWYAQRAGVDARLGAQLTDAEIERIANLMVADIMAVICGGSVDASLWVTAPLHLTGELPRTLSFSGGVAEYVHLRQVQAFGDLGLALGSRLRAELERAGLWGAALEPHETIRATVIGASQYTVQVSGNTVSVSDDAVLPVHNVRVVKGPELGLGELDSNRIADRLSEMIAEADLDPNKPAALAFGWTGRPFHARLDGVARAIAASAPPERPLILIFDADVAGSVGTMLRDELGWRQAIVCLDGITVGDFDYVDVGRRIDPSGAYPVVVKSLMFSSTAIGGDPK